MFSLFSCLKGEGGRKPLQFTNTGAFLQDNDNESAKQSQQERSASFRLNESRQRPSARQPAPSSSVDAEKRSAPKTVPVKKDKARKTELEQKIIDTQDKHPSEKKDIFKAIFDDSSDDEEEAPDPTAAAEDVPLSLKNALGDFSANPSTSYAPISDEALLPRTAKQINILRNTSPPRGIFSNLLSKQVKAPVKRHEEVEEAPQLPPDSYGPSLPPTFIRTNSDSAQTVNDAGLAVSRSVTSIERKGGQVYDVIIEEKWIEKEKKSGSDRKKKKDEERQRNRHKKSKKKDKKEHKKDKNRDRDKRKKSKH